MCGIAGFTQFHNKQGDVETLREMGQAILHRGPDDCGEFLEDNIGLCHRRLSIIDLSTAGHQPMHSYNDQYTIVFNGEIYNFLQIREQLIEKGYRFNSHSDTEVLLALYQEYGLDLLQYINGMFAFAIWDKAEECLFLARDRIGKKPLYYYKTEGDILFTSEIKALLTLPQVPKKLRLDAVYDFFAYQYVPDPKSIFEDIYKLEAGHYILHTATKSETVKYWDVSFANVSDDSEQTLKAKLFDIANDCTKKRMLSDVPLGAFLSGGVDSSGVVALMAKNSNTPVTTCSIGFDEEKFNETEFAKIVALQYKTQHHEFTVHQNVADSLELITSFFDEPFADPSLVPTFFVAKLAREKVTVAISGDGGDEVFAGYSKYTVDDIENSLRNKFPNWLRKGVFPAMSRLADKVNVTAFKKASSLLNSLSVDSAMGFYITNSMIKEPQWQQLVRDEVKQTLGDYHPSKLTIDRYNQADGEDHLSKILYTDIKTYLTGGILVKVDRMSMANSLEVRAPLLDYELIEFAARLPSNLKYKNGEKKYLLKEAFKDSLPDDILYRKKMGFSVPLASWLRNELRAICQEKLIRSPSGLKQIFNLDVVTSIWEQHLDGKADNSNVLWSMLMFQMWWDKYMTASRYEKD
jgi:asparagine synthase (glutamine-hydrolysing)